MYTGYLYTTPQFFRRYMLNGTEKRRFHPIPNIFDVMSINFGIPIVIRKVL